MQTAELISELIAYFEQTLSDIELGTRFAVRSFRADGPQCIQILVYQGFEDSEEPTVVILRPSSRYYDRFDVVDPEDWEYDYFNGAIGKELDKDRAAIFALNVLRRELQC